MLHSVSPSTTAYVRDPADGGADGADEADDAAVDAEDAPDGGDDAALDAGACDADVNYGWNRTRGYGRRAH